MKMLAIPFRYKQKVYHSLVRVKQRTNAIALEVTIMNGELETKFYGHHTFSLVNGQVEFSSQPVDSELRELQLEVRYAIHSFVQSNPLNSYC
jgi:hypothetical protein